MPAMLCLVASGCGGSSGSTGGGGGGGDNNPTTVTVTFTGATPTAVASQIGTGSFTAATLSSNSLSLSIPHGTTNFAVAYVCQIVPNSVNGYQATVTDQVVIEASTLDGTLFSRDCASGTSSATTGTLTGSVDASAIPGANYLGIAAANGSSSQTAMLSGASSTFSESMPAGTDRVAVAGYVYTTMEQNGVDSGAETLAAVRNFDGVAVPGAVNSGNTVTLGATDAVTAQPITYKNVAGGLSTPITDAYYVWSDGGSFLLSFGVNTQYPAVPADAAESGDYYSFVSVASMTIPGSQVVDQALVDTNTTASGPLTVTFPAPWTYTGPTPAAQPVFDMANSGITGTTGLTEAGELSWSVGSTSEFSSTVIATGNYLNGSTSLTFPALTGLTGFVSAPSSGTVAAWYATVSLSPLASLQPLTQNGTASGVENLGSFTVP
ncbi:MAG TPA: hypothetical protein VME23_04590 [Terracidiphilus sp.]|nr:hypothetical protein [Terracidiphilus sp.]